MFKFKVGDIVFDTEKNHYGAVYKIKELPDLNGDPLKFYYIEVLNDFHRKNDNSLVFSGTKYRVRESELEILNKKSHLPKWFSNN